MSTTRSATPAVYGGLFLVTLATIMYEIALTRIFSVTMWYHFAFVAISVAMFGMTVGALVVYLRPGWFPAEQLARRLGGSALLFGLAIVFSLLTQLVVPFTGGLSLLGLYTVVLTYVVVAVPFVFSGICVTLALTRFRGSSESLRCRSAGRRGRVQDRHRGAGHHRRAHHRGGDRAHRVRGGRALPGPDRRRPAPGRSADRDHGPGHVRGREQPADRRSGLAAARAVRERWTGAAAAVREVELVLADHGLRRSHAAVVAPGLGTERDLSVRPRRPPARADDRRRRRDRAHQVRRALRTGRTSEVRRDEYRPLAAPTRTCSWSAWVGDATCCPPWPSASGR